MKAKITVSKPYIKQVNSDVLGKSVRLCAMVTMKNPNTKKIETKECFFEFETSYKKYLCPERSDAFVTGLLSTAMEQGMDIEFSAPISERLYYQLCTYYIPMVAENNRNYPMHKIQLIGPYDNTPIKNSGAVATGCSGGVDSFCTILKHNEKCIAKDFRLTHLVYSSSGVERNEEERLKDDFKKNVNHIKQIAKDCHLDIVPCYNNLYQFSEIPFRAFTMFYTTTFGSVAYALQKLFTIYYVSSGDPISYFSLDITQTQGHDSSVFDVFTTSCMNTENITFEVSGMECTRIEKQSYIADYAPANKSLAVCGYIRCLEPEQQKYINCSHCSKCLRTMSQFYAINKLENFSNVFDVDTFLKHKNKSLGKMIGTNKKNYVDDMIKTAKKNNVPIPISSYLYAYLWFKPIERLRKSLRHSLFVRKIWYKFNLDYKIDGIRGPYYQYYQQKFQQNKRKKS